MEAPRSFCLNTLNTFSGISGFIQGDGRADSGPEVQKLMNTNDEYEYKTIFS